MASQNQRERISRTFLSGPDVQARYNRSHVTIWRWANNASLKFPRPMKINRLNYWNLDDLEGWEKGRSSLTER